MHETEKSSLKAKILGYLIRFALWVVVGTCRFKVKGSDNLEKASSPGPCLIMLWHNRLALIGPSILATKVKHNFTAFASNSKDGLIVAEYTCSYPNGRVIRVPHDSREKALKTLVTRLKMNREIPIITPDGPRGPRYELKPGVALAAKEAKAQVVPFSWSSSKYYELKSWDRFRIPLPFTTITAMFGEPITLSADADIEGDLTKLKQELDRLA